MKPFFKQSVFFFLLMMVFTPLAFVLMPAVAIIFVVLALAVLFLGWQSDPHQVS